MPGRKKKTASAPTPPTHGSSAAADASDNTAATAEPVAGTDAPGRARAQGKGRPTPRRKDQEAARRRPVVPEDRKAAKRAQRDAAAQERMKVRMALETGDEQHLPARDRGRQRRFVRDLVDARTGVGEWLMPLVFLYVLLMFIPGREVQLVLMYSLWAVVAVVVIESILLGRTIGRRLTERFGEPEAGTRMYGVMRALQFRRLRLPKPQVRRGEHPA